MPRLLAWTQRPILISIAVTIWLQVGPLEITRHASWGAESVEVQAGTELFERVIRPTLIEHCYPCHSASADDLQAGLRIDSRDGLRRGGDTGPAVVPGDVEAGTLIAALKYEGLEMPPDQKLPDDVIDAFAAWIELGAVDPREEGATPSDSEIPSQSTIDWEQARTFWAFQPISSPDLPAIRRTAWPRRRLDHFVIQQMEARQLTPSPPAEGEVWLRRVSMDLVGLPPTLTMRQQGVDPADEDSVNRVVDQLLASVQFGEKWARIWLDLARYAEDQAHIVGNDKRLFYPNAYLYRNWVIAALNRDLGYDQFIRLQLAADLCAADEDDWVALGFLGLGPKYYDRGRLEVKAEEWEDRVDTVCRTLLGLTVACARCHDHKYDPITTADYHALASVFASTEMYNRPLTDGAELKNGEAEDPSQAMHIVREGKPTDLHVFIRGNVRTPGESVARGFLTILSPNEDARFQSGSGRRELAERIIDRRNPLTARVLVNRIWGELLGRPLVSTPSNFGALGQRPTHPRLLDDLSAGLMENHWSIKWLIREIVTSATYRQSSGSSVDARRIDPQNIWLSHMNRKRLTVETWRDTILSATGRLQAQVGGTSMQPDDPESTQRTVYSYISRFELNPMLSTYDFPDANVHSSQRVSTTTPLQKLFAMNHPFLERQARAAVERLGDVATNDRQQTIDTLYRAIYSRGPTAADYQLANEFLDASTESSITTWSQYTHALLASNELLFVD